MWKIQKQILSESHFVHFNSRSSVATKITTKSYDTFSD